MKKILLLPVLLILAAVMLAPRMQAQAPCTIDPQYTTPGIFPSDTIADQAVGAAVNEVVHFLFPPDTMLFGFTLEFDSFVVNQLINQPSWLQWDCDQNQNNCTYYTNPPALTQGCVAVTGTPTAQNPSFPAWDSVIVIGQGWVTVPFVGAVAADDSIAIYYRVDNSTNVDNSLQSSLNLEVNPNPAISNARISYRLVDFADIKVSIHDIQGREVAILNEEESAIGDYSLNFNALNHPTGLYFVRVSINGGQFVETKKLVTIR